MDALFSAVSAVTETGLGSVEMHRFSLSDQITLLVLMLVGSQVFTSAIPLFLSRLYSPHAHATHSLPACTPFKLPESRYIRRVLSWPILRSHSSFEEAIPPLSPPQASSLHNHKHDFNRGASYIFSIPPSTNFALLPGDFLTKRDCIHSKSIEDNALAVMSWVTTCYFVFSILVGFLICQIYILCSPYALGVLEKNQVNSSLFSLFSTVSAFANCGFILLDENLVPMQKSIFMLICLCALILMGNTLYAPTMRFVICVLYKIANGERRQVYGYILNASQRRFTHLFPRKETIWLVGTVVVINAFQVICILGLDWRSQALKGLGVGYKIVTALFQSITTRSAGMNVVNLFGFSTSTLLVSLGAMYIASYPLYLSKKEMRKMCNGLATKPDRCMLIQQLLKLRAQDTFLFLASFLICIFEREAIKNDSMNFSFFNIIFEVISGYGNVGLSIGYDCGLRTNITTTSVCMDTPCSLSGRWSVRSKMVLIVVMLLGRQKGLSEDIDWGIS